MSSSRFLRAAIAFAVAVSLGGCFQPLYGEAAHPGLAAAMKTIDVAPIADNLGHYLQDFLITDINGTGEKPPPKYRLVVTAFSISETPTVQSQTSIASS